MNIKNNIFAGILIFVIVLLMPYYWQFIGYEPSATQEEALSIDGVGGETKSIFPLNPPPVLDDPIINSGDVVGETTFVVSTNLYRTTISSISGGSHKDFTLLEMDGERYRYLGAYVSRDDSVFYDSSAPVNLLDNDDTFCAPCLGSTRHNIILNNNFVLINSPASLVFSKNIFEIFLDERDSLVLEYQYVDKDYDIVKKLVFHGSDYIINHEFQINKLPQSFGENYEIIWGSGLNPAEPVEYEDISYGGAYLGIDGGIEYISQTDHDNIDRKRFDFDTEWMGIRNKYFAMVLVPEKSAVSGSLTSFNRDFMGRDVTPVYSSSLEFDIASSLTKTRVYLGPLKIENVEPLHHSIDQMMNFGWKIIQPISKAVVWFLVFLHTSLGLNYGLVLIVFAFIIRIITGPLIKKSYESSQKMQKIAPDIKIIQEKYKDDPKKLQKEMMALYKRAGANPFSGCLPMLLQWPILMALFIVFRSTVELRGEPFIFWITDLSQPDYVFGLPFSIPLYGDAVAILPLMMGITMFLVMKQSMATMDSSQKPMLYMMNGMFLLIFNSFPSGLTLYYTMYNLLSYLQQRSIKIKSSK